MLKCDAMRCNANDQSFFCVFSFNRNDKTCYGRFTKVTPWTFQVIECWLCETVDFKRKTICYIAKKARKTRRILKKGKSIEMSELNVVFEWFQCNASAFMQNFIYTMFIWTKRVIIDLQLCTIAILLLFIKTHSHIYGSARARILYVW